MARAGVAAVEHVLHRELDVGESDVALAVDLDPVGERRRGSVGPARATVVRDVLVEVLGEVGLAVDVVPRPIFWHFILGEIAVCRRRRRWGWLAACWVSRRIIAAKCK